MLTVRIGETDISKYVQTSAYKMENTDVYDTWVDGNHITHKHIYRKKVIGNIELVFTEGYQHDDFLDAVRNSTDIEGKTEMTVYVPAMADTKDIYAYLTISSMSQVDMNNGYLYDRLSVAIEEA